MTEQPFDEAEQQAPEDAFDDVPDDVAPDDLPADDVARDDVPGDDVPGDDVPADDVPSAAGEAAPATGHPAVDEVLRSLDALEDAPVDEHVAVFEQAHEQFRRTLQGAGDEE